MSVLGLVCGILTALVIIAFRLLTESAQGMLLPGGDPENYEGLAGMQRFALATGAGVILGLLFSFCARWGDVRVGVIHVMERLARHEGHLPLRNAVLQFIGAAVSIIGGHSLGREGPCTHLGAASASLLGQWLGLPNNSIRILTACGVAAAIAAAFDTPLAGVVFAVEVVLMEYAITGLAPVILAAVSATVVTRALFYSSAPMLQVPALELASLWELPLVLALGISAGLVAVAFIRMVLCVQRLSITRPAWVRMAAAGALAGLIGMAVPEVMGVGYDTANLAAGGGMAAWLLALVLVSKLTATALCVGSGLPAGAIGPSLLMGCLAGALLHALVGPVLSLSPAALYVLLGMVAMLSATLHAPLAALLAVLELSGNPGLLLPGMLAVVAANLTARGLSGGQSLFLAQLRVLGLDYHNDPVSQSLQRIGVTSIMDRKLALVQPRLSRQQAVAVLQDRPQWLVILRPEGKLLMPAADLAAYLEQDASAAEVELPEILGQRTELAEIGPQATVRGALRVLQDTGAGALYVGRKVGRHSTHVQGILTRAMIEHCYHPPAST